MTTFQPRTSFCSAPGYRLRAIFIIAASMFLSGCGSSALLGRLLLPDPGGNNDSESFVKINGVGHIPCLIAYCFFSTNALGGRSEDSLEYDSVRSMQNDQWLLTLQVKSGATVPSLLDSQAAENSDCITGIDLSLGLPDKATGLACALGRIKSLFSVLMPANAAPPIDVSVLLLPLGDKLRSLSIRTSFTHIPYRVVDVIYPDGTARLEDISKSIAHELVHAYTSLGYIHAFPSTTEEETAAYNIGLCAAVAVGGNSYAYESPDFQVTKDSGSNGILDLNESLAGSELHQSTVRDALGKDSAAELSKPEQAKQLFKLCKDSINTRRPVAPRGRVTSPLPPA